MEKQFPSARYPQIRYTPGEEIWVDDLLPDRGRPFYFDVGEEVTGDEELVRSAAEALDHMEELEERARGFLRAALEDGEDPRHKVIDYFLKEHCTEMDDESLSAMLGVEDPLALSQRELLDMLVLQRFGNTMDDDEGQMLILDFCFHPDYTDQLAVVYLNMQGELINISHES